MHAIEFLVREHNKVRELFSEISDPSNSETTKKSLFDVISHEIVRHESTEQQLWYPKLKQYGELGDIIKHLVDEEKKADTLMKEIKETQDLAEWNMKVSELIEEVEHHAEEEEKKLFSTVGNYVSVDFLREVGDEMLAFKRKIEKSVKAA